MVTLPRAPRAWLAEGRVDEGQLLAACPRALFDHQTRVPNARTKFDQTPGSFVPRRALFYHSLCPCVYARGSISRRGAR